MIFTHQPFCQSTIHHQEISKPNRSSLLFNDHLNNDKVTLINSRDEDDLLIATRIDKGDSDDWLNSDSTEIHYDANKNEILKLNLIWNGNK